MVIGSKDSKLVYLGKDVSFTGTIESPHNLYLAGEVNGEVRSKQNSYILSGAHLRATITSENIQIVGLVEGDVSVQNQIMISPNARVFGNLTCQSLQLDEGAIFCGNLSISREYSSTQTP